jgi:GrpB-like predicted nucleotidyltransferase (UPF0157 family)
MRIKIVPYDDQWPKHYRLLANEIRMAAGDMAVSIEHVGSTAVDGLSAKPIIDIMVGMATIDELDLIVPLLIDSGFTFLISERHINVGRRTFFLYNHQDGVIPPQKINIQDRDISASGFEEIAHIHCWIFDSPDWHRHLAFRDYLRAHSSDREMYQMLKENLSARDWESSMAYSKAKNEFIADIHHKR